MARKCDCHVAVEMLERDPRLRAMPLAPRMLWFALVRAMQSLGVSVLRFGSVVPDANEVAMMVGISRTELEANLQPILARGLLVQEGDGALSSPLLAAAAHRSEVNKINGSKGGQKRREQAADRRAQRELLLPIPNPGADDGSEREAKPAATPPPAKLADVAVSTKPAVADADYHAAGRAALEAMGIDQAKSMAHYGIVRQWLADGATPELIVQVIRSKMRPGVGHLGYFTKAVGEAVQRAPAAVSERGAAYARAVSDWRLGGRVGAMPQLEEFGHDGVRQAAA